jgi:hypothetical protein
MAASPSTSRAGADPLPYVLMNTMVASVRSDATDFSARQLAVFLKAYLEPGVEHTVRVSTPERKCISAPEQRCIDDERWEVRAGSGGLTGMA